MSAPALPPEWLGAAHRIASPGYERWRQMVAATGGCAQPIRLTGERIVADAATGEIIDAYSTADEPTGYLLTACGNRRASRCPSCAETYRADTFQLIRAGLAGGKGVPESVSSHPVVFATLTAPSFGPVHAANDGKRCRPRRSAPRCPHRTVLSCYAVHGRADEPVGSPLCVECYDYPGAVLWNAHAGKLWHRFTVQLPRALAAEVGMPRRYFLSRCRVSFAKVAEYQARGLVHFHAIIRLDGPTGSDDAPPAAADLSALDAAIRTAAAAVAVPCPDPAGAATRELTWGAQLDVQPIHHEDTGTTAQLGVQQVAGYVAKYATKGAEAAGTVDRPIKRYAEIATLSVTPHARRMIETCWQLAEDPRFRDLRLAAWSHTLGYRGHFTTKSRRYSTTLGALRTERANYRAAEHRERHGLPDPTDRPTHELKDWTYAGQGYHHGERLLAEAIRDNIAIARHIARQRANNAAKPDRDGI